MKVASERYLNLGELMSALKSRLSDSNKNLTARARCSLALKSLVKSGGSTKLLVDVDTAVPGLDVKLEEDPTELVDNDIDDDDAKAGVVADFFNFDSILEPPSFEGAGIVLRLANAAVAFVGVSGPIRPPRALCDRLPLRSGSNIGNILCRAEPLKSCSAFSTMEEYPTPSATVTITFCANFRTSAFLS